MTVTTTTRLGDGGEDRVLATAQQVMRILDSSKEVREDMLLIFSSFDNRLSHFTDLIDSEDSKSPEEEAFDCFEAAKKVILSWDASISSDDAQQSTSLLNSPDAFAEYFSAVDQIIEWVDQISIEPSKKSSQAIMNWAENAIQLAMSRLKDELHHVLIRSTVSLDTDSLYGSIRRVTISFSLNDGLIYESLESFGKVNDPDSERFHERGASLGDDMFVDLVHPDAVRELKQIVNRMIISGYEKECLQVYISVHQGALDECLVIIGVEKLSIEDVHKAEWKSLDEKMKKWIQTVKIVIRVLLDGERRLCDSVFGEWKDINGSQKWIHGHLLECPQFGLRISFCNMKTQPYNQTIHSQIKHTNHIKISSHISYPIRSLLKTKSMRARDHAFYSLLLLLSTLSY